MNKIEKPERFYYQSEKPEIIYETGEGYPFVVFNVATHGDEYQPVVAVEEFLQNFNPNDLIIGKVRFTIANPAALRVGKRFLYSDLNRAYPGNMQDQGENKIAAQMLELVKDADYVIDLHTAPDPPSFVILGALNQARLQLAELAPIKNIVLFEATTPCAMVDITSCGIGIELGAHESEDSVVQGMASINNFMSSLGLINDRVHPSREHDYYEIYGSLTADQVPEHILGSLINFQPVANFALGIQTEEEFSFPVLCGAKDYSPVYCYLAKKVDRERLNVKL